MLYGTCSQPCHSRLEGGFRQFQCPHATPTNRARTSGTWSKRVRVLRAMNEQATGSTVTQDVSRLRDPARIGAKSAKSLPVKDSGGDVSLSSYMTLPVEQYFVLDPSMINFKGRDRFELKVPPIQIMNVILRPVAEVSVRQVGKTVVLETTHCKLYGSDLIESLNDKFAMKFVTQLTWDTKGAGQGSDGVGEMTGDAELDVWCEVVPPFGMMPRGVLEGSCNVVMAAMLNTMLPMFLTLLRDDYLKWAQDAAYRQDRAGRSELKVA